MMFDWTINIPTVLAIIVPILGTVIWALRLEGKVASNEKAIGRIEDKISLMELSTTGHREQLKEFQLLVAREYMTSNSLHDFKQDMIHEFSRMEKRIETQIDRLIQQKLS